MPIIDRTAECDACGIVVEASVMADTNPSFAGPDASDPDEILSAVVLRYDADGRETSRTAIHWPSESDVRCACGAITYDTLRDA
jgi:hypothetical protein